MNGPFYWEKLDEGLYAIEDLAEITVQEIPETNKIDWELNIKKFPIAAKVIVEDCKIKFD